MTEPTYPAPANDPWAIRIVVSSVAIIAIVCIWQFNALVREALASNDIEVVKQVILVAASLTGLAGTCVGVLGAVLASTRSGRS